MQFLDLVKKRYSCRKFSDRPVEQEKIDKIIEAGMVAPTAVNIQPFKIWVISGEKMIEKVSKSTPFTFGAKVIFAVGSDNKTAYKRSFDNKNFAEIDASIVATHMMLAIHDLNLGTTWVGHFNPETLKQEFPQFEDYEIVALFPTGYPAEDAQPSEMHSKCKTVDNLVEIIK